MKKCYNSETMAPIHFVRKLVDGLNDFVTKPDLRLTNDSAAGKIEFIDLLTDNNKTTCKENYFRNENILKQIN